VTAAVLAAGAVLTGAATAQTAADRDDANATGPAADRVRTAAVEHVGGGRATSAERESEGRTAWEVEVQRTSGDVVEVELDADATVVRIDRDDRDDDRDDRDDDRDDGVFDRDDDSDDGPFDD
jgi:uncharacterized membrane protein YkoI